MWGTRIDLPGSSMTTAIQLLTAGVVMTVIGPVIGERIVEPPPPVAWAALAYLAIFGSLIAFSAYIYLLKTVRPALSTSYAYVNPVVAVVLGLTLGGETVTGPVLIALPLIVVSVILVAGAKRDRDEPTTELTPAPLSQEEAA
jgi:drug/metabolite transporter (DMT)-like permease